MNRLVKLPAVAALLALAASGRALAQPPHPTGAAGGGPGAGAPPTTLTAEEAQALGVMNRALIKVASSVTPAVVNIASTKVIRTAEGTPWTPFLDDPFFRQFFGDAFPQVPREVREQSLGSGFIVDRTGIVVTNHHVVERATSVKVGLADGRELEAQVVGTDPQTDVAVLRIRGTGLPAVVWGDSGALQPGETVLAIGNPFGLSQTVTHGIVSAVGRSGVVGGMRYENFVQTDASINPGNSGGPLVNVRGEVVGINSAIRSTSGSFAGISFAIPSNLARRVVESVVKTGHVVRGWLGAEGQNLTPELARQFGLPGTHGVLVTAVQPASPADKAGLARGDVVLEAASSLVADTAQLDVLVAQSIPGSELKLTVWRGGARESVTTTIAEAPDAGAGASRYGNVLDGLRVQDISPALARRWRVPAGARGVLVVKVVPGTPAEEAGFEPGDVIQGLNRREVHALREYDAIARAVDPRSAVVIYVARGGEAYFVTLSPE